ncbi:phosphatidylinositol-4-phosphate 5-kinase fab1 PtdIns 4 P-5-kinase [Pyrenophora tritici-repentis]|uniref:protein-ribulosamine 3-kinase n=1 Tax=Pyrenophora tritici-repentis TaxID=45151 RepID=A0A2W1D371_9PLEO|nr:phosphatidylinositol-4-phosphate 5-kinase fab1 [Pyrenophora tritici-repentis]KAF7444827.1 phosphatidylinositol-4-phosphate 5-kinase fab1 [Pyrenophora tritici-repentis]KAF7564510.1 phosphatidylinositol-4-phosphate 5-kinase fab1 (PtdIns(4)P-5-kinase) [Pyrenophora tritici-repentis]KAG9379064.1 phosphatidylinositol-4-phosphate 5-kinase fab1 [Pyrenophora tritici-repentis]KAI0569632.1 phosphatidylinositol-4-phosphate 5-kinase fab1 (PtdIns(4)P-5-kinase) [Pyrenophora tritici-repentis]
MKIDPAVVKLLGLNPDKTNISSVGGGSSFASTSKIVSQLDDGTQKAFFMKTGSGKEAEVMFEGEHASLKAIHDVVPSLCPQSFGHGQFESQPSTSYLVTDFLHLTGRSGSKSGKAQSLAAKLAKLHTTPAPNPEGYDKPMFGFPATTCCGDTPQDNSYKESWADFYAENRLRFIVRYAEQRGRRDGEVRKLVERTASEVVPRLIGDAHLNNGKGVTPVVVHGDLWSGNASVGVIGSDKGEPEDVVYDSSACYAHSEFELGIMKMFGGFGGSFLKEYHEICPKTEPVEEYADRVKLYELYHHLNHYAMFGGSYRSGAVGIMNNLIRKYGGDG